MLNNVSVHYTSSGAFESWIRGSGSLKIYLSDEDEAAFFPNTVHSNSVKHWNKYCVILITTGNIIYLFTENPNFPRKRRERDCNTYLLMELYENLSMNFI